MVLRWVRVTDAGRRSDGGSRLILGPGTLVLRGRELEGEMKFRDWDNARMERLRSCEAMDMRTTSK
jgi:hypothetical protein